MIHVDWTGFILASIAVVLAPGPGSVFVAKTAAASRVRAGLFAMMGIMVGDTCLIVFSLLGFSALFRTYPSLFHVVRFAGASYVIYLGLRMFFPGPEKHPVFTYSYGMHFRRAVAVTLFNPKAIFFFMTFFPLFIKSAEDGLIASYAAMTVIFMSISIVYLLFVVHTSAKFAAAFQQNRTAQLVARKLFGCIFIGFGLKAVTESR
jgi:leucine efflux protein